MPIAHHQSSSPSRLCVFFNHSWLLSDSPLRSVQSCRENARSVSVKPARALSSNISRKRPTHTSPPKKSLFHCSGRSNCTETTRARASFTEEEEEEEEEKWTTRTLRTLRMRERQKRESEAWWRRVPPPHFRFRKKEPASAGELRQGSPISARWSRWPT